MNDGLISRRGFLRATAGAAAALTMTGRSEAASPYYRQIVYKMDNGFSAAQSTLVSQATALVAARMLDPRMLAAARRNYRYYQIHAPGRTFRTAADFEGWVHYIQMQALRVSGFPRMLLYGRYDANGQWTGRASVATVTAEYASFGGGPQRYYTNGTFAVTLNTALLGNPNLSWGRSPDYWAGVIGHEMLHNLGHSHPEGVYNGIFIRAYENAIARNG